MIDWEFCDRECEVHQGGAECVACIMGVSEIELREFQVFLEARKQEMHESGLSSNAIESILDAVTV